MNTQVTMKILCKVNIVGKNWLHTSHTHRVAKQFPSYSKSMKGSLSANKETEIYLHHIM